MIGIVFVLSLIVIAVAMSIKIARSHDLDAVEVIAVAIVTGAVMSLVGGLSLPPLISVTGGLMPDYGTGERIGYVTKLSRKGVIWKTWEGQVQLGVGEMASLQSPFEFSVPDEQVRQNVQAITGAKTRVCLTYKEWLRMPYWLGDSGYEIIDVKHVPDDNFRLKEKSDD